MRPNNDSSFGATQEPEARDLGLTCAEEQVLRMRLGLAGSNALPLERKSTQKRASLQQLLRLERCLRQEQKLRHARPGRLSKEG